MKVFTSTFTRALEVAAIVRFSCKHRPYYVLFADRGYYLASINECTIVDYSYRHEWRFNDGKDTLDQKIESFDEMYNNPDFLEALIDGVEEVESLFEDKRRLYAGPNIQTGKWLGFNYPIPNEAVLSIDYLFQYGYPRGAEAQIKREELERLVNEINQSNQSQLLETSQRDIYAFNLSLQLDEIGVAMFLLRRTGVSSYINAPIKLERRILSSPIALAVENQSLAAIKLLLGYGARPTQAMITDCTLNNQIKTLLTMPIEDLYTNGSANLR